MKSKILIISTFLVLSSCCGCATWGQNERADLLASQKAFAAVVRSLADARMAGQIGEDEIEQIDFLIHKSQSLLDNWTIDVLEERESIYKILFKDALSKLIEYRRKGVRERDEL